MNSTPWRLLALALVVCASCLQAQVGGGYTDGGLRGEYFANADLKGPPAFTRREVRLDCDWGTVLPIGGSNDPRYRSFPLDNFSARYTGRIIAAFTETYTVKAIANDGVRVFVKAEGALTWTTLIDAWSAAATTTGATALVAGKPYEVRIEYRELTGAAALRLLWSSPSTPEEVIDPLMHQGFNVNFWGEGYADLAKSGRPEWNENENGKVTMDARGWPQNDASLVIQETINVGLDVDPLMEGTVTFAFKGSAEVRLRGNLVGDVDNTTPTYTYDAATNTTSGTFRMKPNKWNASYLLLSNTDRDGKSPARKNGVTDLTLMRCATPGGTSPYPVGTIFIDQARAAGSAFTALRVNLNNANGERFWSDRTLPTFFNQSPGKLTKNYYVYSGGVDPDPSDNPNGPSWEYSVMLANETGADLYINLPAMASGWTPADTTSYVYKLAQLIRYGSDGSEPYAAATANPVFPPLNPNLRVYVELSNEVWNPFGAAFRQFFDINEMMKVDVRAALGDAAALADPLARAADFPILNFDKLPTTKQADGNFEHGNTWRLRKIILRTVQISDIFRSVWGDANMGSRIRPLYEWQYGDYNSTASVPLKFIDDYFNNGDGLVHVAKPHPVSYFIWGGGGASYYGAVNSYGVTEQLTNPGFETPVCPAGYNPAPAAGGWTYAGTAGIARDAGEGDDIPPGWEGSAQCGYIAGTGSMSMQVAIPATQVSNTYGFVFKAVQRVKAKAPLNADGQPIPDTQQLKLYVNDVELNWKSFNQSGGYTPTAYDAAKPWNSLVVFWSPEIPYYSSSVFTAAPGSTVTLRIEGAGAADQIAFLEDVRLASVDRMFADGFPGGGEANGQPAGSSYASGLNTQASWALAYGLKYVTYEGGWSLGGDTGGTPLQNTGKYRSPDAAVANAKAIDMFHQAGGYLNTFGTYALWPSWQDAIAEEGLLNIAKYPLISSQNQRMNELPAAPANGLFLPNVLTPGFAALGNGNGSLMGREWVAWNVISTTTSTYAITLKTTAGGTAQLWVDGLPLDAPFATGSDITRTASLTKGIHGLRLQALDGTSAVMSITVSIPGAPAAPAITTIVDGSGTKTVQWGAVTGATGYIVRWGTDLGIYTNSSAFQTGTSMTLKELIHDQTYHFIVTACNAVGLSLPSADVGSTALVDGKPGRLACWDFAGATGNEATMPPSSSTSRLVISGLKRGPGLMLSSYKLDYTKDSFAF
ncbi:MAG TPA: hypothetical protein DCS97_06680, partial [Planctomycetes bacterium]|nr:hypothetical protein [Planctomycetota bacterium]